MTGCGKSTQVPQYILDRWLETGGGVGRSDDLCNVICTQPRYQFGDFFPTVLLHFPYFPRRISAIGVAERVAAERGEKAGEATVGYQVRLFEIKINKHDLCFYFPTFIFRDEHKSSYIS